jgi:two-component system, OmpR family, response regulator
VRILVVEDEHKIANAIKRGLEQETYAVDVAYNGADGLDLLETEDYDLLILDLMLPEVDGLTITKTLRSNKNHIPILILTAKGETTEKVEGLDAGADDYLTKPFSFEELLARVRALSRRPQSTLNTELSIDGLTLNTTTYEVKREGQFIQLSHKEFALLEYLMRNSGTIVSKEKIMNHVWNYDSDILPNTVEVYIKYLRNKIDKPFSDHRALIQTVRGFGYKIQ